MSSLIRTTAVHASRPHCLSQSNVWRRCFTASRALGEEDNAALKAEKLDVEALLSKPTWSISSLLPPKDSSAAAETITSKQLYHLLRLSALPPPSSPEQEVEMTQTLQSQLHFVRSIQAVDTSGVQPLRSLRDETAEGQRDAEIGMKEMREALDREEIRGKWHCRIRRKRDAGAQKVGVGDEWDVLGHAERKRGRYFVVEGGKKAD